ncbi:Lysosomal alpha-mannosidase [Bulinus truncatus]|nr:Lysosomal alpha-mannosidase [Bulinus truncatus]
MSVTHSLSCPRKIRSAQPEFEDLPKVISIEHLSLEFDLETGLLESITNKDSSVTEKLKQEFLDKAQVKYFKGPLVQEVHQTFSPWVSQVIRLYKGAKYVEFQWTVGPIDDRRDLQGKEVISLFTTSIKNEDTFYTDSNGRELVERIKDFRDSFNFKSKDNVSQNYYPVTSRICIKDIKKNVQLTVLTDRPQGGSSLAPGAVELMVHRRVMKDDDLGLAEGLQDLGADGMGVIYTGKHYMVLDTIQDSVPLVKHLALQVHLAPAVMFTPVTKDSEIKQSLKQETFLAAELPPNVHILTLDRISSNETHLYLLRIEHLMEEDEHKQLSSPAQISLQNLFNPFEIVSVVETTLGGNFIPADLTRLTWKSYSGLTPDNIRSPEYKTNIEPPFTVTLRPMEIRTFNILVNRISS